MIGLIWLGFICLVSALAGAASQVAGPMPLPLIYVFAGAGIFLWALVGLRHMTS
jgi:purine-cytosine permease-like protein